MNSLYRSLEPTAALNDGEHVVTSFYADKRIYIRDHIWLAVLGIILGMGVLWLMGNPHFWTGAVGAVFAVAVRGFYLASDDLKARWDLTNQRAMGPQERIADLTEIREVKTLGSAAQIITRSGLKHLIRFQADPKDIVRQIEEARVKAALQTSNGTET
ncbi:hypothetical protein [Thalassobius sp. I31.1]|uniref:hypothetical protein n=1 Tax=Thalassobius sp. I31.1 TaxID=2109912 RepID=UPI000D1A0507|nr:hypothetical protein [Thalassobius sp. I31.1]